MEPVPKLEIFQRVRKYLASLGYRPNQSPFNKTQLWIFVKVSVCLFLQFAYLREPYTPKEFMNSMYMLTTVFLIAIIRVDTLFKNAAIFAYLDKIEKTINRSELNFILKFKKHSIFKLKYTNGNEVSFRTEIPSIKKVVSEN